MVATVCSVTLAILAQTTNAPDGAEARVRDFIITFTSILYEALPFIILGAILAGVLEEFVPQSVVTRLVPKNRFLAIVCSSLLGLVFPMCECGIVPIMRRLLRKGLPLGCCTAYLLAGPIINPLVILSTVVAFQPHQNGMVVVVGRIIGGFVVAVVTSLIVERVHAKYGNELLTPLTRPRPTLPRTKPDDPSPLSLTVVEHHDHHDHDHHHHHEHHHHDKPTFAKRIGNVSATALHDFVDITVFLILGSLLAAGVRMALTHEDIERISYGYPVASIVMMMGLAIVLCLCSEADAFVAASFTQLQPAAKLAFLVLGPMMDLKLYFLYTRVFRPRLIFTIFGSVLVQVLLYSLLFHFLTTPTPTAVPG